MTNALIHESSPYLLQHAHNPVDWKPWHAQYLQQAREEGKLLVISIGYAACHWCHVMERESFEDSAVAEVMNRHFVSIKVDREERPDIDQVYMQAALMGSGRGGWPLNAIALPDGRPVFVGTYFRRERWLEVLRHFSAAWETQPDALIQQAEQLTRDVRQSLVLVPQSHTEAYSTGDLDTLTALMLEEVDFGEGGLIERPKFPMPAVFTYLLHYSALTGNEAAQQAVDRTLHAMAGGGIYDALGGGFARYSTDILWRVPHFEKMLYDNAQLVSLYARAWQHRRDSLYRQVVYETVDFVRRELMDPTGGCYSSIDADSDGEEGAFYVWDHAEIVDILGPDTAAWFCDYYSVSDAGNWDGRNILYRSGTDEEVARRHGLSPEDLRYRLRSARAQLLEIRNQRPRPAVDDKILTAWNALILQGFLDAWHAFGEPRFRDAALKVAWFLESRMLTEAGTLLRSYRNGEAAIPGFLDDYAFTIGAFLSLYEATFDPRWLAQARELADTALTRFGDPETALLYYTSNEQAALMARPREVTDNVIPSSNAAMAQGLFRLGRMLAEEAYIDRARSMLDQVRYDMYRQSIFYAHWAQLQAWLTHPFYEVVVVGPEARRLGDQLRRKYLPNTVLLGGTDDAGGLALLQHRAVRGKTLIYVCRDRVCQLPVETVEAAWAELEE